MMAMSTHNVTTDIIKFFQAFIRHMAKVGGKNLPKTISSSLGAELGKTYLKRQVTDWKSTVTGMFEGMGGKIDIFERAEKWVLKIQYPTEFCPIGGKKDTERFNITTESVCVPYLAGFLKITAGKLNKNPDVSHCIVREGGNTCEFQFEFAK
jgi:hypothetical protein